MCNQTITRSSNNRAEYLRIGVILVVCFLAYANTLRMDFVYDDIPLIKELPSLLDLRNIPRVFVTDLGQIMAGKTPYYRPLVFTSFALDHFIWKENPFGYHLTSVILHTIVSLLVYLLAGRIVKSGVAAFAAGLLFAVHPVNAEAVAWITARNDLLAALFMFFSYFTFLIFREKGKKTLLFISLISFFLALLSKEMAITLPLLILLHVCCFTGERWQKKLVWPALYVAMVLPYLLIRVLVLDMQNWGNHPFYWKLCTGIGLVVSYTRLLLFPVNLSVFYNIPIQKSFSSPEVLVPLLLLSVIAATIIASLKYDRKLFFSLSWVYVTLLPVSGFVALLNPALMAERYLYIPAAGFCMAVGILFSRFVDAEKWSLSSVRAVCLAGAIVIIMLLTVTVRRNHAWENQHAFMVNMIKDAAGTEYASYFLGTLYKEAGRADAAIGEFSKALALNPNLFEAHYSLGILYSGKGKLKEAEEEFHQALALNPKDVKACNNLGVIYAKQGKIKDATIQFYQALRLDPDDVFARENLEKALLLAR